MFVYIISSGNQMLLKELQFGTFVDFATEQSIFERYPTQRVSLLERFSTVGGLYRKKDVHPRRVSTLQIWVSASSLSLLEDLRKMSLLWVSTLMVILPA